MMQFEAFRSYPKRKKAWFRAKKNRRLWLIVSPNMYEKLKLWEGLYYQKVQVSPFCASFTCYETWPLDRRWDYEAIYNKK